MSYWCGSTWCSHSSGRV
ncbi:hypothetical protein Goarm_020859 [Gossypium armourianum]|uniref:Uncharacterized protein n=1 Tax=Gossypium armourianum TaxID=34283 RepID=A0A7J9IPZ3_9ROSI|nr:hypothetical protein [Gossypium armourianum]